MPFLLKIMTQVTTELEGYKQLDKETENVKDC